MYCPYCGQEQLCPCESCKRYRKPGDITWVWKNHDFIACGKCNFTRYIDWWEDLGSKREIVENKGEGDVAGQSAEVASTP